MLMGSDTLKVIPCAWDCVPSFVIEWPIIVFDTELTEHALILDEL